MSDKAKLFLLTLILFIAESNLFAAEGDSVVVFNEIYQSREDSSDANWIELYNQFSVKLDISGWRIKGPFEYTFPENTIIDSKEYLVVASNIKIDTSIKSKSKLFISSNLSLMSGDKLKLFDNNNRLMDVLGFKKNIEPQLDLSYSKIEPFTTSQRSENWASSKEKYGTPGRTNFTTEQILEIKTFQTKNVEAKDSPFLNQLVVNEIFYNAPIYDSTGERHKSREEWIELYNSSAIEIDLAQFELSGGVKFTFPKNSKIGPSSYLVVAKDQEYFKRKYPEINSAGNYKGGLSNSSDEIVLKDPAHKVVDRVKYYSGGSWPQYADGGGASLELMNLEMDRENASSWCESQIPDSEWETYSYTLPGKGLSPGPDGEWEQFIIGLLGKGEILIDDLSLRDVTVSNSPKEIMHAGNFEGDTSNWEFLGNHRESKVESENAQSLNKVLRIKAFNAANSTENYVRYNLPDGIKISNSQNYEISMRVKYIKGTRLLNTRLFFNRAARTKILNGSDRYGTPGKSNSCYSKDPFPNLKDLKHAPIIPKPDEKILFSVKAFRKDSIEKIILHYRVDELEWQEQEMQHQHDGLFETTLGGGNKNSIVQYFVEAIAKNKTKVNYPKDGKDSRALLKIDSSIDKKLQVLRIITRPEEAYFLLEDSGITDEQGIGVTAIFNEQEIYPNIRYTLRGSPNTRRVDYLVGFTLLFPQENLFRQIHSNIGIDRSGREGLGYFEILANQILNRVGGLFPRYVDAIYLDAARSRDSGPALLKLSPYSQRALSSHYKNGSESLLYDYDFIYTKAHYTVQTDRGEDVVVRYGRVFGIPLGYYGESKESYRWHNALKNYREEDDYQPVIELNRLFSLSHENFMKEAQKLIDIEQWLRAFALGAVLGNNDNYPSGTTSYHNALFYKRPADGKFELINHDLDGYHADPHSQLDEHKHLERFFKNEEYRTIYYQHIKQMLSRVTEEYIEYWANYYIELMPNGKFENYRDFLKKRRAFILQKLNQQGKVK